jgi:transcriptional/translational regulatory protein YebC/TACO1
MAKAFTRIEKDIVMAEGGPNPEANSRLRAVIQNSIQVTCQKGQCRAQKKKATDKDTAN